MFDRTHYPPKVVPWLVDAALRLTGMDLRGTADTVKGEARRTQVFWQAVPGMLKVVASKKVE
jgi:hypothetical protein